MSRCPQCQRPIEEPAIVCKFCLSTTRRQLSEIPVFIETIENDPETYLQPARTGSGGKGAEMSIGIDVNALSYDRGDDTLGVLAAWEVWVRYENGLSERRAHLLPKASKPIRIVCDFLLVYFEWISRQKMAGDFVREVNEVWLAGVVATKQLEPNKSRIRCPGDFEEGKCEAWLQIGDYELDDEFSCPRCRHPWTKRWLYQVAAAAGLPYWTDLEMVANLSGLSRYQVERRVEEWGVQKDRHGQIEFFAFKARLDNDRPRKARPNLKKLIS